MWKLSTSAKISTSFRLSVKTLLSLAWSSLVTASCWRQLHLRVLSLESGIPGPATKSTNFVEEPIKQWSVTSASIQKTKLLPLLLTKALSTCSIWVNWATRSLLLALFQELSATLVASGVDPKWGSMIPFPSVRSTMAKFLQFLLQEIILSDKLVKETSRWRSSMIFLQSQGKLKSPKIEIIAKDLYQQYQQH